MSNDNYTTAIGGFGEENEDQGTDNYYIAADSGAMNTVNALDGSFVAYCTFYLRGDYAAVGLTSPTSQFLWGTLDAAAGRGWALRIDDDDASTAFLTAILGTGDLVRYPISYNPVGGNASGSIDRLVMAGLWFDGANLVLTINGNIVGLTPVVGPFVPGTLAARMGFAPAGAAFAAVYTDIISCGFYSEAPFGGNSRIIGAYADAAFRGARQTYSDGHILPESGIDWTHRYSARGAGFNNRPAPGSVTKNSIGAAITAPAPAPATLADIGQNGALDQGVAPAVALNRVGTLFVPQQKATDFLQIGVTIAQMIPGDGAAPQLWRVFTAPVAGGGGTADIPGPAAGYIRAFDSVLYTPATVGAAMASVTTSIQPLGLQTAQALSGTSTNAVLPPSIVNGESLRVTNAGANPIVISVTYFDEPIGSKVVFRTTVSGAVFTTLVPAPAVGTARIWLVRAFTGTVTFGPRPAISIFNNDTVAHTLQFFYGAGATLLSRSASAAAAANLTPSGAMFAASPGSALTAKLSEAVITNPINIFGTYEIFLPA